MKFLNRTLVALALAVGAMTTLPAMAGSTDPLFVNLTTDDAHRANMGIGFGKNVAHNLTLLRRQRELLALGAPVLVGWSRKSTLGALTGRNPGERTAASVAAALLAVQRGARIVRVHDVAATVDALAVWQAAENNEGDH